MRKSSPGKILVGKKWRNFKKKSSLSPDKELELKKYPTVIKNIQLISYNKWSVRFFFKKNSYIIYERHFRKNFHETTVQILCFQATPCSPHIFHGNKHKLQLNQDRMIFIVWTPSHPSPQSLLFIAGLGFLKIHRRGESLFSCKNRAGVVGRCLQKGGEVSIALY